LSDPDLHVVEQIDGAKGRYTIRTGEGAAEMTFSIASPVLRIVDHTQVPRSLQGRGVGRALFRHLVTQARAEGFRVVPLCPFVSAQLSRHIEDADLFQI